MQIEIQTDGIYIAGEKAGRVKQSWLRPNIFIRSETWVWSREKNRFVARR